MIRSFLWLVVLFTVFAAGSAGAVDKQQGKKLYRWVDKEGKVHYVDALPAEAVDQARKEFNASTGSTIGSVDRALTPEERAKQAQEQEAAAKAAIVTEQQKRNEEAMLTSYQTEADLRHAYDERITLLKQTLESTDMGIKSLRGGIAKILSEASEAELNNRPVDARRTGAINEMREELVKQQTFQANRKTELLALDMELERMLVRYRELRAASAPPMAATTPP